MALLHSAFLFDYARFREDVDDLLSEASKGNFGPLYNRARESVQNIVPEDWILDQQGTNLSLSLFENRTGVKQDKLDESAEAGYRLLVILSLYLERCPSLGASWGLFEMALKNVGWSALDVGLLIKGFPVEVLLNPSARMVQSEYRELGDPYWRWAIPTQAYASGWLPIKEVHRLRAKLEDTGRMLERVDFAGWPAIDTRNPVVVEECNQALQRGFADALAMLSAAEEVGVGIFAIIS